MEAALLAKVIAEPHDPGGRMVYADWLEERGDRRAAYLRIESRCAALVRTIAASDPPSEGLRGMANPVSAIAFAGAELVAVSRFAVRCWSLAQPAPLWSAATADTLYHGRVEILADHEGVLTIAGDGKLVDRNPRTGKRRAVWDEGLHSSVTLAATEGDSCVWAGSGVPSNPSGYRTVQVRAWDCRTRARRWTWDGDDWTSVNALAMLRDRVIVVPYRGPARVLGLASGHVLAEYPNLGSVTALRPIRDDRFITVFAENPGRVAIWAGDATSPARETEVAIEEANDVTLVNTKRIAVVSGWRGGKLAFVRTKDLRVLEYVTLGDQITALASSLDGKWFAAGTDIGDVHVFAVTP